MKRIYLQHIILCFCLFTGFSAFAYSAEIDGICYNLSGDEAEVTSQLGFPFWYSDYSGSVIIPPSVTYENKTYPVTKIGHDAFNRCKNLISITLPYTLTSIGNNAFNQCEKLTSITIPNSVTSIGSSAFQSCFKLTSITIPNSVTRIGNSAFEYSAWYNNQPDGMVYAGKVAYKYKGTMPEDTHISIREGTLGIAASAFSGCNGLTSITIPNTVTIIGAYAFSDCSRLASIFLPKSVTYIENGAFYGCRNLNITITNDMMNFEDKAFGNGSNFNFYVNRGSDVLLAIWDYMEKQWSSYHTYDASTSELLPCPTILCTVTQTTIKYIISNIYPEYEYECDGNGESLGNNEYLITGLRPDYQQVINLTVRSANHSFSTSSYAKTKSIKQKISSYDITASSIYLKGSYKEEDAKVISSSITINGKKTEGKEAILYGLDPNTTYECKYNVVVEYGSGNTYAYEESKEIATSELFLTPQQPKVISEGNVIVAANTNLYDEETNVGFEWRRIDWTDDFESKTGSAYLFEGMMEGYIRSINSNYLWKFRPYYTSNAGNTYYGEWKGMDPSDYSYFEPTVRTYGTVNVSGNSAEVKGYAMRGTDRISNQGFMYWSTGSASSRRMANGVPSDAKTVLANGNVMTATLENLEYNTQYSCVAFVTTEENETFYGEVQTFTTDAPPYAIGDLNYDNKVDIADAVTVLNIMASGEYNKAADLNGDNKNDIADFVTVLNIMAGQGGE